MQAKVIKAGLLGRPLSHSLSPEVFNIFSRLLGIQIVYSLRETEASGLTSEIAGARAEGWSGFNITIPHKQAVLSMLNLSDPAASAAGAVNAVRFGRAGLEGLNTDARALLHAFQEHGISAQGKSAVVFGAGGAAGAAGWALGRARAASVCVLARNTGQSGALIERLSDCFPETVFTSGPFAAPENTPEIVVNATPLGMYAPGALPFKPGPLSVCADFAYTPAGTEFTGTARAAGAKYIDGLELLVTQAALALKFWTGLPAGDIVKFTREALALLREKTVKDT